MASTGQEIGISPLEVVVKSIQTRKRCTLLTALVISLLHAATTQGENQWTSLNGPWEAWEPKDIAVGYLESTPYVYAIGGQNRGLLLSKDEGDKWMSLPLDQVVAIACVENLPTTVYAAREDGSQYVISKSIDAGRTWVDEQVFTNPVARVVVSPNAPSVVFVGLGGDRFDVNRPLWQSVDGGINWKEVAGLNIYSKITQICFDPVDLSVLYVSTRGTMGGIWKSTDAGGTWSPKNNGMTNVQIASFGIARGSQHDLLLAGTSEQDGGDTRIYNSTDGGNLWTVTVNNSGATDIVVDPIHPHFVYAATKDGVMGTKDFGVSWLTRSNGLASKNGRRIAMVCGSSQQVHVLLGTQAAFYRTDDDGEHWNEKTLGMSLVACYGAAVNTAGMFSMAYGGRSSGSFVNRRAGGATWNVLEDNSIFNSPIGSNFYGFAIAGGPMHANVLLASGTSDENLAQILFRSSDAGTTWEKVYNNDFANQPCNIIFDPNDDRIVYTADLDQVLKSNDGGITWSRLLNSPPYVYSIGVAASRDLASTTLFAGGSWQVYKSDDGGKTWFSASTGLPSPVVSLVCDPVDSQIVFAGTNHHRVYRTTNGGSSWQPRSEGVYGDFIQSMAVNPVTRVLYACAADYYGAPTRVYRSTNFGETWRDISIGLEGVEVYNLTVGPTSTNTIVAATNRGIFHLLEGSTPLTGTVDDDHGQPSTFELRQNYPNPFNPSTTISYQLPTQSHITLKLFDVLGRETATLVNEEKQSGTYAVQLDASGFASGVYYYRILARPIDGGHVANFVETKKLLLLK